MQAAPCGGKFIYHPKEAHSAGMVKWLRKNFSDLVQLNPGWNMRCREVLTNNPHVCMYFTNQHPRSIALYNATEEEVEESMRALIEYGQKYAPRGPTYTAIHQPTVVSYDPVNFGAGTHFDFASVQRRDIDGRIDMLQSTTYETFRRPGQVRPLRQDKFNRGRGDDDFFPGMSEVTDHVNPLPNLI